jgi:hypothetical protein
VLLTQGSQWSIFLKLNQNFLIGQKTNINVEKQKLDKGEMLLLIFMNGHKRRIKVEAAIG